MKIDDNRRYRLKFFLLALIAAGVFLGSFAVGRYAVAPGALLKILWTGLLRAVSGLTVRLRLGALPLPEQTWSAAAENVVLQLRLPRVCAAALVGAALSAAGAAYQGMFRNPMVSPDLLGASTGAGFGAALAILLGAGFFSVTLAAFVCGLAAVLLAYLISRISRVETTLAMVLAGMMISSLFTAGTSFIKLVADPQEQLPAITYWLMGSLASVRGRDLLFALVPIAAGLIPLLLLRWRINLLTVSEAEARSIGVDTTLLRFAVILCATLMTAGSVAVSGMIGWVGLVIPHFCRLIFGQNYSRLIPASALFGAAFLMLVDDLARMVTVSEIPIGILTAFVGAPVFLYLLLSGGDRHEA